MVLLPSKGEDGRDPNIEGLVLEQPSRSILTKEPSKLKRMSEAVDAGLMR